MAVVGWKTSGAACWIVNNRLICQYVGDFMICREISDRFLERVAPLLEPFKRRKSGGAKPPGFRTVLNGIFYLLKTGGCQWEHLSACYGSKSVIHRHFRRWVAVGVFK